MEPLLRIAIALEHVECLLTDIRDSLKTKPMSFVPLPPPQSKQPVKSIETPLIRLWNELADSKYPRAIEHDKESTRTKNTVLRWLEKPDEDHWKKVILKLNASDWCKGINPTKWVADFDFMVKPESHWKIVEGKYDNKKEEKRLVGYTEKDNLPVYTTVKR